MKAIGTDARVSPVDFDPHFVTRRLQDRHQSGSKAGAAFGTLPGIERN
jgi:hypothetical protein